MAQDSPGLSSLFPPLGRSRFLARHWPARPSWSHGPVARLGGLRELGELGRVLILAGRSRVEMKAVLAGTHHKSNEVPIIDPGSALNLYEAGATIVFNSIHRWHEAIGRWTRRLGEELGLPGHIGGCNLYVSPRHGGLAMHFDDHEVIAVQLAGSKRWRFAENRTVRNPTRSSGPYLTAEVARYATARPPRRMPAGRTIELRPGSVLFLPRGYWHTTKAREASISLSFGFRMPSWAELLRDYVAARLVEDGEWREPAWHAWRAGPESSKAEDRWSRLREDLPALLASTTLADLTGHQGGAR